jgi:hypothetical protein
MMNCATSSTSSTAISETEGSAGFSMPALGSTFLDILRSAHLVAIDRDPETLAYRVGFSVLGAVVAVTFAWLITQA